MSGYDVLAWQNETGLSSYPLTLPLDIQDFLVDASFIQFDNFIPGLRKLVVSPDTIEVTINFDCGEVIGSVTRTKYNNRFRFIQFYTQDRYLGVVSLGAGTDRVWLECVGQTITRNIPFRDNTVRSIPSKDAVYTIDSKYGDIVFGAIGDIQDVFTEIGGIIYKTQAGGNTMLYNESRDLNSITFNAVGNHKIPDTTGVMKPLKKINLVAPINNNIYIQSNDVIKFKSINNLNLSISLVGNSSGASIVPTLTT
jgi:hypothetical protein